MVKILLVDDEASLREMMVDELTVQGHDVVEASNGEDGLKKFLEHEPDMVLCDRAMPVMSGYDFLSRLRGAYPQYNEVPFVFMTALTDPRDKEAVSHLNASGYIEKPVDFGELERTIAKLLAR